MVLRHYGFRAMGCPCAFRLYAEDAQTADVLAQMARRELVRIEHKYSRYREDSLASALNRSAGDPAGHCVDDETAALLDYAETAWRESAGLFDPTSGVLRRAWDFRSGRIPERAEVAALQPLVGWERVTWQRPRLVLPEPGMELDFGGFVKEYAADRLAELCRRQGCRHGLVDLGGDLAIVGPHPDGKPWRIGVRDPRRAGSALASLEVASGAVATSGDYERHVMADGTRYGHILDPRSGWPVAGLPSVTVSASHCLIAGTAATVAVLHESEGPAWLARLGLPHVCLDHDGSLHRHDAA